MGRTLDEVMASLPPEPRTRIDARYRALRAEVESLGQLRQVAGKAQAEIAAVLHIRQPSVSKMERQADMYLSTLRGYIEAIGGELELVVRLPSRPALRLAHLGDVFPAPKRAARASAARKPATARS